MSFCSFSKEFMSNSFTSIENQFILKYMPQSDGFTVKVYIYGLYLCQNSSSEMDISAMSEFFNCDEKKIHDAFSFWEDYDLVRIISEKPFAVEYLPVATALGRPKRIRYDKYADFNKELQDKFQKTGKFVSYGESIRYMNFLQENNMEQQAFLLIAQYCINKKGEKVTQSYILNKAKKFISQNIITYQQVEHEFSGYNIHEKELINIFSALNTYKKPEEGDYTMFDKWTTKYGFSVSSIIIAAKTLKRGSIDALDIVLTELYELGKTDDEEVSVYLRSKEILSDIVFKVARKLSIKINSPQTYIEEYVEKWYNMGYDISALENIAVYCTKASKNSFMEMDVTIEDLYKKSIISDNDVNEYLSLKNAELKLLIKIKGLCGGVKINESSTTMISVWHEWNFSDTMILAAAKRSVSTVNPISYMNKILSDWKHNGIFKESDIPESSSYEYKENNKQINKAIQALDDKAERERYYANLRRQAQAEADKYIKKAETNPEYVKVTSELSSGNIELAKAKVFSPDSVTEIQTKLKALKHKQLSILKNMNIEEHLLYPNYSCKKCNDSGFLPNGKACDCYKTNT